MGERNIDNIKVLEQEYGKNNIYSWSRISCYMNDPYEYFLKYILKVRPDNSNMYASLGGVVHDCLEKYYTQNDLSKSDLISIFTEEYKKLELGGLKFDRVDEGQNKKISDKYISCCANYLRDFEKANNKTVCEKFVPLVIKDTRIENDTHTIVLQCYIDFMEFDKSQDKPIIKIVDYKTSTKYTKTRIEESKGQLLIYALAIYQLINQDKQYIDFDHIKISWDFIKYVECEFLQQNGKYNTTICERNNLLDKLENKLAKWCEKLGYSNSDFESFKFNISISNTLDCLPSDLKEKFTLKKCIVEIPFNEEEKETLINKVIICVNEIISKEKQYQETKDENIFWDELTDNQASRLLSMGNYSPSLHKPLKVWLDNHTIKKNAEQGLDSSFIGLFS